MTLGVSPKAGGVSPKDFTASPKGCNQWAYAPPFADMMSSLFRKCAMPSVAGKTQHVALADRALGIPIFEVRRCRERSES